MIPCCAHNHGIGWPYYTEEAWLATYDGGLCASLYVSCQVTALVGANAGTQVTIIEETNYPYDENIQFRLKLSTSTQFKFYLRIPNWCQKASTITLNGKVVFNQKTPDNGSYIIMDRLWVNDDVVSLNNTIRIKYKNMDSKQKFGFNLLWSFDIFIRN